LKSQHAPATQLLTHRKEATNCPGVHPLLLGKVEVRDRTEKLEGTRQARPVPGLFVYRKMQPGDIRDDDHHQPDHYENEKGRSPRQQLLHDIEMVAA
jgi:hypothetical protein